MVPENRANVALVLGIVHLAVLRQVRRQSEGRKRVCRIAKTNVGRTRGHVCDAALWESGPTCKRESCFRITDARLLHHVCRPVVRVVKTILFVMRRNRHKSAAGDRSRTDGIIAVLVYVAHKEAIFVADLPITPAGDLSVVKRSAYCAVDQTKLYRHGGGAVTYGNGWERPVCCGIGINRCWISYLNPEGAKLL